MIICLSVLLFGGNVSLSAFIQDIFVMNGPTMSICSKIILLIGYSVTTDGLTRPYLSFRRCFFLSVNLLPRLNKICCSNAHSCDFVCLNSKNILRPLMGLIAII